MIHGEALEFGWWRLALRTPTLPPATTTNAMLVGVDRFVVVDPGAEEPEEQQRLAAEVCARLDEGGTCVGIILTHHHHDHTAGLPALVATLAQRQGSVAIYGHHDELARLPLPPRARPLEVEENAEVVLGRQVLRFLHTPGHTPGHLAIWDASARLLYAGDMVAGDGTILIAPPDGDMAAYMGSLERLLTLDVNLLVPAHGEPIEGADAAQSKIRATLEHRRMREDRVLKALSASPRGPMELVPAAYPEIQPAVYPLAAQSLTAHLIKLAAEGRAVEEVGRWRRASTERSPS